MDGYYDESKGKGSKGKGSKGKGGYYEEGKGKGGYEEPGYEPDLPAVGEWLWPEAKIFALEVEVDAAMASTLLPPPGVSGTGLSLADPVATVFVADYPNSLIGPYKEAAILLRVIDSLDGEEKLHCPWMVVDDDVALILGREGLGYPKKLAKVDLEVKDHTVWAQIHREGKTILSATSKLVGYAENPKAVFGKFVNVIGLALALVNPELYQSAPLYLIRSIVEEEILAAYKADYIRLSLPGGKGDPFEQFGFGETLSAMLYTVNFGRTNVANTFTLDVISPAPPEALQNYIFATAQLRYGFADPALIT